MPESGRATRLGVVSVVRDEADILPAFLRHLGALFNDAILIDHRSRDGSREMLRAACAAHPGWRCWQSDLVGHHQREIAGLALHSLFNDSDADWVLLLDADEFIDVPDRAGLLAALAPLQDETVARLAWRNCIPAETTARPDIGSPLLAAPERSPFGKVAVPRALWRTAGEALRVSTGFHVVEGLETRSATVGELLHLPLRSAAQAQRKALVNRLANLARARRGPTENYHLHLMAEAIAAGVPGSELVRFGARYGERDMTEPLVFDPGLIARCLDVAAVPAFTLPQGRPNDAIVALAATLCDWQVEDTEAAELLLDGDSLRLQPKPGLPADDGVTALARCKAELAAARGEALLLRQSRSWRLTAPLRWLADSLSRRGSNPLTE